MIGTTLSHYTIESELGRGGMGIVYKARDTKLDRPVAIKILPSAALASKDDRERFYREAKSAAQLHHPNIASVFEIDEAVPEGGDASEPRPFIAMEFISGETLHDLISKGPMKLADAVNVTAQVADALKAAHAKDIVHRDIKSANVMITEDGVAKVLDFGLAKTNQSTMLTRMGSTLGTVAYMSPEQARGQEVDGRTDLYSLGTMLYEMVAGRLPFAGEYEQAVVYSILNEPPEPLTSVRTGVPMDLERLVNKLMAKDADYRYQTAADLLADLKSLDLSGGGMSRRSMPAATQFGVPTLKERRVLPMWAVAGLALLMTAVGVLGGRAFGPQPEATVRSPVRFAIPLDADTRLTSTGSHAMAISPDGSLLATVHERSIHVRPLSEIGELRSIDDLERVRALTFDPTGQWLAYEGPDGWIMRVSVNGGSPRRLAQLSVRMASMHWGQDGFIYLAVFDRGIGRVSEEGGPIEMLPSLRPDSDSLWVTSVFRLPSKEGLLYANILTEEENAPGEVRYRTISGKEDHLVVPNGFDVKYVASGHILYLEDRTLWAAPFDPTRGIRTGTTISMETNVWAQQGTLGAMGQFAVSDAGTLVKLHGDGDGGSFLDELEMVWLNADGQVEPFSENKRTYVNTSINPVNSSILAHLGGLGRQASIWLMDGTRGTSKELISPGANPVWSPDGEQFVYSHLGVLMLASAENPGEAKILYSRETKELTATDWSPDGRYIVFNIDQAGDQGRTTDIGLLDTSDGNATDFLVSDGDVDFGRISPDGKWLAYEFRSASGGQTQIEVRPFPDGAGRFVLEGWDANKPHWTPDGSAIFFISDLQLASASFNATSGEFGATVKINSPATGRLSDYSVHQDGRILWLTPSIEEEEGTSYGSYLPPPIHVVVNWTSLLPKPEK